MHSCEGGDTCGWIQREEEEGEKKKNSMTKCDLQKRRERGKEGRGLKFKQSPTDLITTVCRLMSERRYLIIAAEINL